jgi:hypothetical protein
VIFVWTDLYVILQRKFGVDPEDFFGFGPGLTEKTLLSGCPASEVV